MEARMDKRKDPLIEAVLDRLIEHGPEDVSGKRGRLFDIAMRIERERFLGAALHERSSERIDTPAGSLHLEGSKNR